MRFHRRPTADGTGLHDKSMNQPSPTFILRSYVAHNGKNYYDEWVQSLDRNVKFIVLKHVKKLIVGLGRWKNLGDKLWELKIEDGPGYRVYFYRDGMVLILLLAGSEKRDQDRTIALARSLIKEIEEDKRIGIYHADGTAR